MKQLRARRHHWVIGGIVVLALVLVVVDSLLLLNHVSHSPASTDRSSQTSRQPAAPRAISAKVLVFGNAFWGRNTHDWSMASPLKYQYPFSGLAGFHRDQYNAWIAGLECPTDPDVHMTAVEQEAELQFNCRPEFLPEAAKWFTAFTLANNHTDNQGVEGFAKTRQELDKNGIQYFGHYDPRVTDEACEVISLPVSVTNSDDTTVGGALPVAMCGFHGVFRIPPEETIAQMERYSQLMPVLAFPHMGVEYEPAPDQLKVNTYRSMIDHGADVVLGDHPHWVQTTEAYKGHLIVYSMGNFMFDQQGSAELTRSAAIKLVLRSQDAEPVTLATWLQLGKDCKVFQDDCLARAEKRQLTKLPLQYQFDAIGTDDSNKLTKPATPAQTDSILQRLRWQNTISQLHSPYSGL